MSRVWLGKRPSIRHVGFGLAVVVTTLMLGLAWVAPAALQRLEHISLNWRFMLRGERPPGDEVVLVAVDERSLKELGRWPWSRDKQARVVEGIAQDGAKVIGLDLIYPEPEATDYHLKLEEIRSLAKTPGAASPALRQLLARKLAQADTDRLFTQSLRNAKTVVMALPLEVPETHRAGLDAAAVTGPPAFILRNQFMLVRGINGGEVFQPHRATGSLPPLKSFADEAISVGHVYSFPDPDGVTRYAPLALRYGGREDYYPSFALEIARIYLGIPRDRMVLALGQGVLLGDMLVPTDQKARLLVNYVGRARSFRSVSATDVIHKRVPPGTFTGKAVLVGTSALATYDQKVTPFSANLPGLELNATVVDNILHGPFLLKTLWSGLIDLAMVLLLGIGLGAILTRVRALPGAVAALTALLGYLAVAQYVFVVSGIWLDVVPPVLTLVSVFVVITVMRFMTQERKTREIRALFSNYVSPLIVEELIKDPSKATLGGRRKELTMLFSDLAGFTTFSEQHVAEDVVAQLNEYLGAMSEVIIRWNGTLDKFVGDSIVAYWGAPVEQPDHVELAIKCALHMR
ncbi:MAG: CHASE2 domain-containing protein, partial [Nitrospiraceae bacterium]